MIRQWLGCCCCLFASVSLAGEQYAFLVAVREYDPAELTSLSYTERDVTELAKTLQGVGFKESNTVVLTQTLGATRTRYLPLRTNILEELELLCGELGDEDTLLLAFSGHGLQFEDSPEVYFCPADARLQDRGTLLSLSELYERLADKQFCAAETKLILVDACRNDPLSAISKGNRVIELAPAGRRSQPKPPGGLVAFYSCGPGQKSFELPSLNGGHSIFLHSVIEAFSGKADLDGDGELTLEELVLYSTKETQKRARIDLGKPQTPERVGTSRGVLTLARMLPRLEAQGTTANRENRMEKDVRPQRPALLQVPFNTTTAENKQQQWAEHLKLPVKFQNSVGIDFNLIPPGTFVMGNNAPNRKANELPRAVQITRPLYVAKHETTVGNFRQFIQDTGYVTTQERPGASGRGWDANQRRFVDRTGFSWKNTGWPQKETHPVVNVSWIDVQEFLQWLSMKEQKRYRLLTEAEWEYCCRAGTNTVYSTGNEPRSLTKAGNVLDSTAINYFRTDSNMADQIRNDGVSSSDGFVFTSPVGVFSANAFGLFDFHGNVCEWCQDWYAADFGGAGGKDPQGTVSGIERVARGGRFDTGKYLAQSFARNSGLPQMSDMILGFRVALEIQEPE